MTEEKRNRANLKVLGVMLATAAGAGLTMLGWWLFVVERLAACTSPPNYTAAGTLGDSFAPVVGILSSLALGAAIASVLLQRAELQMQRKKWS